MVGAGLEPATSCRKTCGAPELLLAQLQPVLGALLGGSVLRLLADHLHVAARRVDRQRLALGPVEFELDLMRSGRDIQLDLLVRTESCDDFAVDEDLVTAQRVARRSSPSHRELWHGSTLSKRQRVPRTKPAQSALQTTAPVPPALLAFPDRFQNRPNARTAQT